MDEQQHRSRRARKQKKKRNWWVLTPLIMIAVVILAIGIYAVYVYLGVKQTVDGDMYQPVDAIDREKTQIKIDERDNLNILLLGIDNEGSRRGRSDAIIVLTLKPDEDKMQMVSIPRDTRTLIVGRGYDDKINHAYAFGGPEMAIETVENFLNIELDYFVDITMDGLGVLVDELGTITVNNELEFTSNGTHFPVGPIELDGTKTLSYVRMRKQDPTGDFGRTDRQRKVIEGIIKEGATVGNVTRIVELTNVLGQNVGTNMELNDMIALLQHYRNTRHNVDEYRINGSGTTINGTYYYIVNDEERAKVNQMIES